MQRTGILAAMISYLQTPKFKIKPKSDSPGPTTPWPCSRLYGIPSIPIRPGLRYAAWVD